MAHRWYQFNLADLFIFGPLIAAGLAICTQATLWLSVPGVLWLGLSYVRFLIVLSSNRKWDDKMSLEAKCSLLGESAREMLFAGFFTVVGLICLTTFIMFAFDLLGTFVSFFSASSVSG